MRRLMTAVAGVAALAGGLFLGLILVEAGFRVHEFLDPPAGKGFFWVPSTVYGWGLAPGRAAPFYDDQGEFRTFIRINSSGLRDIERSHRKPADVYRILILGDSYMEALQVELEEMFARLLEAELNDRGRRRVEVINTGVSAWGTDNQLLFFRHEGFQWEADLVFLSFTTANDIRESYLGFNQMAVGANLTKPHFSVDGDGRLVQHPPQIPPSPPVPWWRERLRLGSFLYHRFAGPLALPGIRQDVGSFPPDDPSIPYVPADMLVYDPDPPYMVTEAFEVTKAMLLALRDEVRSRGAEFAVMLHNGPWVHDDDRWRFMCARNAQARDTWDRQRPNRIIGAFLAEHDIPYFDLYETFETAKDSETLFFELDPHWRPPGHRLAAATAAEFLTSHGLVPQ